MGISRVDGFVVLFCVRGVGFIGVDGRVIVMYFIVRRFRAFRLFVFRGRGLGLLVVDVERGYEGGI